MLLYICELDTSCLYMYTVYSMFIYFGNLPGIGCGDGGNAATGNEQSEKKNSTKTLRYKTNRHRGQSTQVQYIKWMYRADDNCAIKRKLMTSSSTDARRFLMVTITERIYKRSPQRSLFPFLIYFLFALPSISLSKVEIYLFLQCNSIL